MKLSNLLEKYRKQVGLNKTEAAQLIGISDSYYSRLEKGTKKALTLEKFEKIRKIYKLTNEEYEELIIAKFLPEDEDIKRIISNYFENKGQIKDKK